MKVLLKSRLPIMILILVICVISILSYTTVLSAKNKPFSNLLQPIPTNLADVRLNEIQLLQEELQGNLDSKTRASLQEKLEILYSEATQQWNGIQQLTASPQNTTFVPPTYDVVEQRTIGIIEQPSVPFPSTEFKILNAWQDKINGNYTTVFSGRLMSDIDQGIVIVIVDTPPKLRQYYTPTRHGAVRILEENGTILTLESTDNTLYYFNASTERFVNAQGTPFPATPTPIMNSPATPVPYP